MLQEAAEGGFYRRGGEEGPGSAGGHLSPAPGDERCQRAMEKATEVTQPLYAVADEHRNEGERDEHSARSVPLAGSCPCSLRRAPTSASGRMELWRWRRGWWRGVARSGRPSSEYALNRGAGDAQSARLACQHARTNVVTAWTVTSGHLRTNKDVWHLVLSKLRCYHGSVWFQVQ